MAGITATVGRIYDDTLNQKFREYAIWNGLCSDVTDRIRDRARYLEIPTLDDPDTVDDYTPYEDLAAPQRAHTRKRVLDTHAQRKTTHFEVDDTDPIQVSFSLIDEIATLNGQNLARVMDAYLRAQFTAAVMETTSDQNVEASGNRTIPTANNVGPDTGGVISVASGEFGKEPHRMKISEVLLTAYVRATRLFWQNEGRYVVTTPEIQAMILQEIERLNLASLQANLQDRAQLDAAVSRMRTWEILIDPNIPDVRTAGTQRHTMYFGVRGRTMVKAQPMQKPELKRRPSGFADRRSNLWVYGGMRRREDFAMICHHTIT